ncbi:MAG: hypothetical protein CME60_12215 [Halobacteriovoraceae bacterium]|nr:hypothetical protein [Halobacteriovoraceae bacterium]|tara:strand:+ start:770 stop:1954 length:1185 start_codon:yes stop_codon:yes gene_type:complete
MKKALPMLLLTGAFSIPAHSLEFDYGGQLRVRNQHREFTFSNADRRNLTGLRARANFNIKLDNNLSFMLSPQATKNYGELISTTNDENDSVRNSSGDKYHSGVDIFEAYVLSKGDILSYKIGRQQLNYGDSVILGTRNWTAGGLSFDAIKLMFDIGEGQLDLAYSKISEGSDTSNTTDDADLVILYYKALMRKNLNLDFYILHNNERNVLETYNYGFRLKGDWNGFTYRTENIVQTHQQTDTTEHNIDLEFGYKFENSLNPYVGWTQASDRYDQLYTNRHRYNGIIDVVGRRNIDSLYAGLNYKASAKWDFKFKWMNFKQKANGFGAYNQAVSGQINGDVTKDDIGNEFDLMVNYKKNKYETFKLGMALFSHGDYFQGNPDDSTFIYGEYLVKF